MSEENALFGAEFAFDSEEEENTKEKRTAQSEDDFLRQKNEWTPKVERKEVLRQICSLLTLKVLLHAVANLHHPKDKFDALALLSAAEFLYYSRNYSTALEVAQRLSPAQIGEALLGGSERSEVEALIQRCRQRLSESFTKGVASDLGMGPEVGTG
jgi:hypothetical protein